MRPFFLNGMSLLENIFVNKDNMKTFFLYGVSVVSSIDTDTVVRYDMVGKNRYKVLLNDKEEFIFSDFSKMLEHFEITLKLFLVDSRYKSLDFIMSTYPTVSLKTNMVENKQVFEVLKNLILFESQ